MLSGIFAAKTDVVTENWRKLLNSFIICTLLQILLGRVKQQDLGMQLQGKAQNTYILIENPERRDDLRYVGVYGRGK